MKVNRLMRINDLLRTASEKLRRNGTENAGEEAEILFQHAGGPSKKDRIMKSVVYTDEKTAESFVNLVDERLSGKPLQYILGEWEFYGNLFYVGEGVLIPRAETEMLVDEEDAFLKNKRQANVLDLCAGTGCVGITAALHNPLSTVYAVEKYDSSFRFLEKNVAKFNLKNVHPIKRDIFDGVAITDAEIRYDVLLSNPPYIATDELKSLQKEVRFEPETALDGGVDGLDFYRAIYELWLPALKQGALVSLECGEDNADKVAGILSERCCDIEVKSDFNGLPRIVSAKYRGD